MVGKFVSLFLIQTIFIAKFLCSQEVDQCIFTYEGDYLVFSFENKNSSFFEKCFSASNKKIKRILIHNCFIQSFSKMMKAIHDYSALEQFVIYKSSLGAADFSIYNFPNLKILNLSLNNIDVLTLYNTPNLETLDLSFNSLSYLDLRSEKLLKLKDLNLSGNSFTHLVINLDAIENINLSRSLLPGMFLITVTILNKFYSIDLSGNNLLNISFLQVKQDFNVLDLRNNNISSLNDLLGLTKSSYHLKIYLSSNPLLCSPELALDWLILSNRNISFDGDLSCTFSQSNNQYSIKKYGWMFSNEMDILNEMWQTTQLKTFLEFRSMDVWFEVSTSGLLIMWNNRKKSTQIDRIQLKSMEGSVVHSANISMNQTSGSAFISYGGTYQISEVCLLLGVENMTLAGSVTAYVNVQCTNFKRIYDVSIQDFRTIFIVVTVLLLVTCLALLLYIGYIHKDKFKKKDCPVLNEIELKPKTEQQISPNVQTTEFHNKSYISSSSDASPTPMIQNNLKFKHKPKPNLYLSMEQQNTYRLSSLDNVYDGMDNTSPNIMPTIIRTNDSEDIYDYCE